MCVVSVESWNIVVSYNRCALFFIIFFFFFSRCTQHQLIMSDNVVVTQKFETKFVTKCYRFYTNIKHIFDVVYGFATAKKKLVSLLSDTFHFIFFLFATAQTLVISNANAFLRISLQKKKNVVRDATGSNEQQDWRNEFKKKKTKRKEEAKNENVISLGMVQSAYMNFTILCFVKMPTTSI